MMLIKGIYSVTPAAIKEFVLILRLQVSFDDS